MQCLHSSSDDAVVLMLFPRIRLQFLAGNRPSRNFSCQRKDPISVAVVGVGVFGRNHARVYKELEQQGEAVRLLGVVDPDIEPGGCGGARVRMQGLWVGATDVDDAQRAAGGVGGGSDGASPGASRGS